MGPEGAEGKKGFTNSVVLDVAGQPTLARIASALPGCPEKAGSCAPDGPAADVKDPFAMMKLTDRRIHYPPNWKDSYRIEKKVLGNFRVDLCQNGDADHAKV